MALYHSTVFTAFERKEECEDEKNDLVAPVIDSVLMDRIYGFSKLMFTVTNPLSLLLLVKSSSVENIQVGASDFSQR